MKKNQNPYSLLPILFISAALLFCSHSLASPKHKKLIFLPNNVQSNSIPRPSLRQGNQTTRLYKLALYAVRDTLPTVQKFESHLVYLSGKESPPDTAAALRGCISEFTVGNIVGNIINSINLMQNLSASTSERRLQLNTVRTLMSAVISRESNCKKGLEQITSDPVVKKSLNHRAGVVEKTTSIAIALVDLYASGLNKP